MTIYKKRVSVGQFLKKGIDYKENDLIEIANEGRQVEGNFGLQDIFLVKLADGREGNVAFNQTSMNNCIDAFGEESRGWIGKKVKVWAILSNVQGKMIKVYYFSHPEALINEEGVFVLKGKGTTGPGVAAPEEIPVIEEGEIDPKDIPF